MSGEHRQWTPEQQDYVNHVQCLIALKAIRQKAFSQAAAAAASSLIPIDLTAIACNSSEMDPCPLS